MRAKVIKNDKKTFQLQFKDCHYSIVNSIRRGILSICPTKSLVVDFISENDTGINNDLIKLHMSLIWVPQTLENIVVKLNKTNTTDEPFIPVGPKDFECFQNLGDKMKKIDNPWKDSMIVITKLRPNEVITLEATAVVGTAIKNGGQFTAAHCYYNSNSDFDHLLTVKARNKETPVDTWNRTLLELQKKVERIKTNFIAEYGETKSTDSKLEIYIEGENHTIGGPLSFLLQSNPKVILSGYDMPHPLYEKIKVQLECKGKAFDIFVHTLEQMHQLFGDMKK